MLSRFSRCAAATSSSSFAAPRSALPAMATSAFRFINIHECDSKGLLSKYGCKVEFGVAAHNEAEIDAAISEVVKRNDKVVVKSQILAGGRGKGTFVDGFVGGVHVCDNAAKAKQAAMRMLNNTLVTKQTGPSGLKVSKLFITEAVPAIKRELYLALVLDRKTASPTFIASPEGGMNIEQLAHERPEMIFKLAIKDLAAGPSATDPDTIAFVNSLGFRDAAMSAKVMSHLQSIYKLAKEKDATMVEINPFVELNNGDVMCLDAKISFDDNAMFRQPDIVALEDKAQMDPFEAMAEKFELNYVALDGNVGCLVNGAGLAMATMDIISLYGQKPANFLDVGGSAKTEQIVAAFRIVLSNHKVNCILVNIFGGIMKCDTIANGVVEAVKQLGGLRVPLVVRLSGTNEQIGKQVLKDSGLPIHACCDLDEAGRTAASLAAAAGARA